MALNKRKLNNLIEQKNIVEGLGKSRNLTNSQNYSHLVDEKTNFVLRPITLENIDEAVFREFHRRFKIAGKDLDLLMMDAEVGSLRFQNPERFDEIKEFLSLPYFTFWRKESQPLYRTSPSNKPAIYVIPKMKPQGLVYEEWITPHPIMTKFPFIFKFISTLRDNVNQFERYMLEYFKNKRNVIVLDNERFEIMPSDYKKPSTLEVKERQKQGQSLYVITYEIDLIGYLRDAKDIQKRERPNKLLITLKEKSDRENITGETIGNYEVKL